MTHKIKKMFAQSWNSREARNDGYEIKVNRIFQPPVISRRCAMKCTLIYHVVILGTVYIFDARYICYLEDFILYNLTCNLYTIFYFYIVLYDAASSRIVELNLLHFNLICFNSEEWHYRIPCGMVILQCSWMHATWILISRFLCLMASHCYGNNTFFCVICDATRCHSFLIIGKSDILPRGHWNVHKGRQCSLSCSEEKLKFSKATSVQLSH